MLDLFGDLITPPINPGAYPARPGTGPAGRTCRECVHKTRVDGGNKSYLKCRLQQAVWTGGPGTDIKAGSPACSRFEPV